MKNSPRDKSFFMGRVTASVSHELQNVLAIIRETAGLMQDFLMMGGDCPDIETRLNNSLASIKNQVGRGVDLTHNLNRFAHTTDHLRCPIDARDTLGRLFLLTERLNRNKGFTLVLMPGETVSITHDPMAFQLLCFLCMETLEGVLPTGQSLTVSAENRGTGAVLHFCCPTLTGESVPPITAADRWPDLAEACRQSGVGLSCDEAHPGMILTFG